MMQDIKKYKKLIYNLKKIKWFNKTQQNIYTIKILLYVNCSIINNIKLICKKYFKT